MRTIQTPSARLISAASIPVSLLFLILLCMPTPGCAGRDYSQAFERVSGSVAMVMTEDRVLSADEVKAADDPDATGIGSGVLVSADGVVLTAAHVVQRARRVVVVFSDGKRFSARIIGSDPASDLALLQLDGDPGEIEPARLGDSDKVEVGDPVFVVGAPLGIGYSFTAGYISARRAPEDLDNSSWLLSELFQIDAAVNEGSSGGPLFNERGELIGIISYILSHSGGFEGVGFAVTSNMALDLFRQPVSLWSGMQLLFLEDELAQVLNVPQSAGVLVQSVNAQSSAGRGGIRGGDLPSQIAGQDLVLGGDIILGAGGVTIENQGSYEAIRQLSSPGQGSSKVIEVRLLRAGKIHSLRVPLR